MKLHGVLAPVVTPFAASGELDLDGFRANLRAHMAAGVSGIVVTGSTGEAALLDDVERQALVEAARATVPLDVPLIVGTGAESTRATIARTKNADNWGADAALVVAPHYYGDQMNEAAVREHFERVADASAIPIMLYTIPKYMHFAITPEVVLALSMHENIIGMKDSSGDAALFTRYLEAKSGQFQVLTGSGTLWREALRLGADGGILAVSLFAPALALDVLEAVTRSDHAAADSAQAMLAPLASKIVGVMGVAGVKRALDAVGLRGGVPRPPLMPLAAPAEQLLEELLAGAQLTAV